MSDFALEAFKQDVNYVGTGWYGWYWYVRSFFFSYYRAANGTSLVAKSPFGEVFMKALMTRFEYVYPNSAHIENSPTAGWCIVRDTTWAPPTL